MMDDIEMSYKGFTFSANPESIKIRMAKNVSTSSVLFKKSRVQETGAAPSVISGTGCFFGSDAATQIYRLMCVFQGRGASRLFSPLLPPMKMLFEELTVSGDADSGCIFYTFRFVEEAENKRHTRHNRYTYVQNGENLFDVANRTNASVEYLAQRNGVKDLFSTKEGDKIWLS